MKVLKKIFVLPLVFTALIFSSCSSDDDNPVPVVEEEVITTVKVTLTNGNDVVILQSTDLDGDEGPNAPIFSISGPLTKGTTYTGRIEVLNETESPAENITEEIEELDEEHQFFFATENNVATFAYNDSDGNGNPVGLNFTLTTNASATTGTITVILRHEPNKTASGVSEGDITNAGGSTDVAPTFNVSVE
ncbi:hypothetical protein GCM10023311_23570 [Flaviramulus aquimarinus]|uniref:Type 1 periplasmic binding fold superfamily protein n=1 Tax=Flaviramulus aquimarinus TaxID=1170456 RepID=A0ABP9FC33_9FLAO